MVIYLIFVINEMNGANILVIGKFKVQRSYAMRFDLNSLRSINCANTRHFKATHHEWERKEKLKPVKGKIFSPQIMLYVVLYKQPSNIKLIHILLD